MNPWDNDPVAPPISAAPPVQPSAPPSADAMPWDSDPVVGGFKPNFIARQDAGGIPQVPGASRVGPVAPTTTTVPSLPSTAPSRAEISQPIPATEGDGILNPRQGALFAQRQELETKLRAQGVDPKTNPEYRDLTKAIAQEQNWRVQEGANFLPLAKVGTGLVGLAEKAAPLVERPLAAIGNRLATAAISNPEERTAARAELSRLSDEKRAIGDVSARIIKGQNAGGPTAQDIIDKANANPDKPLTLMDLGPNGIQRLAGKVYRAGGEPGEAIQQTLTRRGDSSGLRVEDDVARDLSGEDAHDANKELRAAQKKAAAPLYKKAFEGGSLAPLEHQYGQDFEAASKEESEAAQKLAAAQRAVTQAKAGSSRAGADIYASAAAKTEERTAEAAMADAQSELDRLKAAKEASVARLRAAQADGSANAKGAVWNPRIQEFLNDPIMKGGIKGGLTRGLEIQRLEALADGKRFNPTEYGVVGMDAEGNPIVGAVPNMRLLDAGKRGLDAIIRDETDKLTGEKTDRGWAANQVRVKYLAQLDKINPDYKAARAAWAGPAQAMDAMRVGEKALLRGAKQNADLVAKMSDADREAAKIGLATKLRETIGMPHGDRSVARRFEDSKTLRERARPFFKSDEEYNRFMSSMGAEDLMAKTENNILRGSQTAERVADDMSDKIGLGTSLAHGAASAAHGRVLNAMAHFGRAIGDVISLRDAAANAERARILSSPLVGDGPSPGLSLLRNLSMGLPKTGGYLSGSTPLAPRPLGFLPRPEGVTNNLMRTAPAISGMLATPQPQVPQQ